MLEFWQGIVEQLRTVFDPQAMGAMVAEFLADAIVAILVFLVFYLLWTVLRRLVRPLMRRSSMDETASTFTETVVKYTILTIGAINAMAAIGINTASVLASLGIAGLTIGFAARDAFSNLISGLLIFLDRPFVIGDLVEIEDHYGRVEEITLRSTRVVTVDGKMLAVPNSDIINKTVASYTNFPHLRLDVAVTVAVTEDLNRVRTTLLEIVRNDPPFMAEPPPRVVVTQLNDYNVAVELQVWLRDERTHITERFNLREAIFVALNEAGVEMPYETIQLTPMEVKLHSNSSGQRASQSEEAKR